MQFLLISQRAFANPNYSLKDLEGHGRIDVVMRCILAATRQIVSDQGSEIYCFLKGTKPHGWLHITPQFITTADDEISIAAKIKDHWVEVFTEGELGLLVSELSPPFVFLSEDGEIKTMFEGTVVLGAQNDLVTEDLTQIPVTQKVSLGSRSLLASHAIIYSRQLLL